MVVKMRVYIETMGCQMNVADTERAATRLRASGHLLSECPGEADVVLFNTCSVRARAEQKVFNRIGEIRRQRIGRMPLIGVMGCVAQLEGHSLFASASSINFVLGTRATNRLPLLLERVRRGEERVMDIGERLEDETWNVSPAERHSPSVAFVPIVEGCNKFCTYCIVPFSRGRERSRSAKEILAEVDRLREEGFREIHLIGQNVNSYRPQTEVGLESFAGATPFSRLLRAVATKGIPRVKFTTSFPRDFHEDIVRALDENQNLCDWIHLPAQSGSDRILRAMRRGYSVADYLARVRAIKKARRRYALTTDIILGFPGETDEDFKQTLDLVRSCEYDGVYIFKYSERKGTPAAMLSDDVAEDVKRERFLALEEAQQEIQSGIYERYIGRELSVLVEGMSAKSNLDLAGHTTCNKTVNFPGGSTFIGQIVRVLVTEAKANSLYGQMVSGV